MLGFVKGCLQKFDMFGYSNFIFYKAKKKLKTSFIGLMSLIFLSIILYKFVKNVSIIFEENRESKNLDYYKLKDETNSNISIDKFPMIFKLELKDILENRKVNFNSILGNEIYIKYINNAKNIKVLKKINWRDIVFPILDDDKSNNFLHRYNFNLFKNESFKLTDYYECESLFYVDLSKLNFIGQNLNGTLSFIFQQSNEGDHNFDQIYLQFNFITVETIIENIKKKDEYYREHLMDNFLTTKLKNGININLKKTLIKSYTNKFLNSKDYSEFDIINYSILETKNTNNFFEININVSNKIEIYERGYYNLSNLFSECGGLITSFKSLLSLVHIFYEYYFLRNLKCLTKLRTGLSSFI